MRAKDEKNAFEFGVQERIARGDTRFWAPARKARPSISTMRFCRRRDAALSKLQPTLEQLSVQIATSNKIQIVILRAGHST